MENHKPYGKAEIKSAFHALKHLFVVAAIFSVFVNLLMLTSPLYMLQVYDRVLASGSVPTLIALTGLMTALFVIMGLLDFIRGRIFARVGARFQAMLDQRVMSAVLRRAVLPAERNQLSMTLKDLESIQQFLSSQAPFAFLDAPWTPIYIGLLYLFHPMMGGFSIIAGLLLMTIAIINEWSTRQPEHNARKAAAMADNTSEMLRRQAEVVRAMAMTFPGLALWQKERTAALKAHIHHMDRSGLWQTLSKHLRQLLQSLMLGLGAWLVLQGEISSGAMIAGSILMGRALAPIDQAIGQWKVFLRFRRGKQATEQFLENTPPETASMALPEARGHLIVNELTMVPPGLRKPVLRNIHFEVRPGEALGVIGASASGKTTLARGLAGLWAPSAGDIRLDGATLAQWDRQQLGRSIGYLPQDVALFDGTVSANIARLQEEPDAQKVTDAAQRAGAHELILSLMEGYNTQVGNGGHYISGGQRQRIGLARALYGDPVFLLLDEPNANLDRDGEQALVKAITNARQRQKSVVVMAHRPSAIAACDKLLMLQDGQQVAYGPRDEVLRKVTGSYQYGHRTAVDKADANREAGDELD